jgi:CheY-like chemotaxis protein
MESPKAQDQPRRAVLVVDDDPEHRASVRDVLEDEGYAVAEAANGKEALDYLTDGRGEPALILLNLQMPVMTGWELLAARKRHTRLATIPVVVASGHSARLSAASHGSVAGFLRKPYGPAALLTAVSRHAPQLRGEAPPPSK